MDFTVKAIKTVINLVTNLIKKKASKLFSARLKEGAEYLKENSVKRVHVTSSSHRCGRDKFLNAICGDSNTPIVCDKKLFDSKVNIFL